MAVKGKTGILLVNLGTPDAPTRKAVYRYLKQFLADPRVIDVGFVRNLIIPPYLPFRAVEASKGYQQLWMEEGSPLKVYGYRLAEGVQKLLGDDYAVELAMRYQNPSITDAIDTLMKQDIERLVVLPLFPQYASASTGSVQEEVMRVLSKNWYIPECKIIDSFYDYKPMIEIFAERARSKYDIEGYDHILFSYHGLPERHILKGDTCNHCMKDGCCDTVSSKNKLCYKAHCNATTRAIVEELGIPKENYTICYQSRLGRDPWIQPYTSDIIEEQAAKGAKRMLVFCPAFVSDCLETTVEVTDEYQELFEEKGGHTLDLVESLNDHPKWIEAVKDLLLENV